MKSENPLGALLTEQVNPHSRGIDALPTLEMLRVINDEDRKVAESITPELPATWKKSWRWQTSMACTL